MLIKCDCITGAPDWCHSSGRLSENRFRTWQIWVWRAETVQSRALHALFIFHRWPAPIGGLFSRLLICGMHTSLQALVKAKDPLFPQRHETLTGVNLMTQSFEGGSVLSFGTDLLTWTVLEPLFLFFSPCQCPTHTLRVWPQTCSIPDKLVFRFGTKGK